MYTFNTTLKAIDVLAENIIEFTFGYNIDFSYKPGQFVMIDIGNGVKRAYSIASAPSLSKNEFVLLVDLSPNGKGSAYLKALTVGDSVIMSGPYGRFMLPHDLSNDIYFIATGTGLAPFVAMIDELVHNKTQVNIHLVHGVRFKKSVFYDDWALNLLNNNLISSYNLYLSRERNINFPDYIHSGYVTSDLENIVKKETAQCLLCGKHSIVDSVRGKLIDNGIPNENILVEGF